MSGANPKYRHTYSTDIHYLVKYKCCSCGALNTDTSQISTVKIRKTGDDGIDLVREDAEAEQELRQAVEAAVKGKRHCIENRSYEALDLKCRCSVCGSRQPWSCFWPVWGFLGGLFSRIAGLYRNSGQVGRYFLVALSLPLIIGFGTTLFYRPEIGLPILLLLFAPSIAAFIRNSVLMKKCEELDEEHLPAISIPDLPDRYEVLNEKSDGEIFYPVSEENDLAVLKKKKNGDLIVAAVGAVCVAGSLIIPRTPLVTNETLRFAAGAFGSVRLLLAGSAGLAALSYFDHKKQYDRLARQIEEEKARAEKKE